MKKIALMLCLLFALSIRMIYSQTMELPAAYTGNDDGAGYVFSADPAMPDATPAQLTTASAQPEKLTMNSSPNPFTSATQITCCFPAKGKLILEIRNMFGETVKTITENVDQEGDHSTEVSSEHLRPGIYTAIAVFKTSDNVLTKTIRIVCNQ
jgi:hypothetical protein